MNQRIIAEFKRKHGNVLRVTGTRYRGQTYLHLQMIGPGGTPMTRSIHFAEREFDQLRRAIDLVENLPAAENKSEKQAWMNEKQERADRWPWETA